ncbi:MAG TPA: hypothetical protein VH951_05475, partial [Dehalococcoidia bacterium]
EYIYVRHYDKQPGPQTDQIRAWSDAIDVKRCEEKLQTLRRKNRENKRYPPQEGAGEDKPFDATLDEDAGNLDKARKLWQETKEGGSRRWGLVADNHLHMLKEVENRDKDFEEIHKAMGEFATEPDLESTEKEAFLAWRAEHIGDRRLALSRFQGLKKDFAKEPTLSPWYLYAASKSKKLDNNLDKEPQEKSAAVDHVKDKFETEAKKSSEDKKDLPKVRALCLDIIALYEKDEDKTLKALVEQAEKRLMALPPPKRR